MPVTVDLPNNLSAFKTIALLDGVSYALSFQWTTRAPDMSLGGKWTMRVLDATGQTVLMGDIDVVIAFPVACYFSGRTPPGFLIFSDTEGTLTNPGLTDLGERVQLVYYSAGELGIAP